MQSSLMPSSIMQLSSHCLSFNIWHCLISKPISKSTTASSLSSVTLILISVIFPSTRKLMI
jgi:hypothetical protein